MAHANGNQDTDLGTIITHTAASAGVTGAQLDGTNCRGVLVFINISAITGTSPTLTVSIKGLDSNGNAYTILQSAALTATGLTVLRVYPSLTAVANTTANDIIPVSWRIDTTIGGTTPAVTAKISANLAY
jgi:hypothetical protein